MGRRAFTPTLDPVAGARLFQTKGCAQCHAINGVGGKEWPDLTRVGPPRSFCDLAAVMRNHLPATAMRIRASRTGKAAYLAKSRHADLIPMGTHGRMGVRRAFRGSAAARVIAIAGCPVMTGHA